MSSHELFKEIVKEAAPADEKTQWFRNECQKRGYGVVFLHGIDEETALTILDGPIAKMQPYLDAELAKPLI